jgi:23S rRNA (adenine2503-C2)-methyltransferase
MRELARHGTPYNLAVSLHAPNDTLRTEIVPTNKRTGIEAILEAAEEYFQVTGRRVTYEYVLLAGRNDGPEEAKQLAKLLRNLNAHVNLIPMNPVAPIDLAAPAEPRTKMFVEMLQHGGVNVTVRKRKGADIDAACGQLRLTELTLGK